MSQQDSDPALEPEETDDAGVENTPRKQDDEVTAGPAERQDPGTDGPATTAAVE
ncbi:MAG: hypothetical protein Q4G43_12025 [Mobilicoccus sp.]|nr:hypothetical protein [Mobilicoccus sp.]